VRSRQLHVGIEFAARANNLSIQNPIPPFQLKIFTVEEGERERACRLQEQAQGIDLFIQGRLLEQGELSEEEGAARAFNRTGIVGHPCDVRLDEGQVRAFIQFTFDERRFLPH
jgi:hypothetical protein